MSMKSMTTMPPMSRSRSWRTISSAASRLLRVTVCSRLPPEPVNLPVFTSTTVIASVRSITSVPPDGSQTLRSIALVELLVDAVHREHIRAVRRRGWYFVIRGTSSGATEFTYSLMVFQASSPDTMSPVKSSLNRSRMTLTSTSGSS